MKLLKTQDKINSISSRIKFAWDIVCKRQIKNLDEKCEIYNNQQGCNALFALEEIDEDRAELLNIIAFTQNMQEYCLHQEKEDEDNDDVDIVSNRVIFLQAILNIYATQFHKKLQSIRHVHQFSDNIEEALREEELMENFDWLWKTLARWRTLVDY